MGVMPRACQEGRTTPAVTTAGHKRAGRSAGRRPDVGVILLLPEPLLLLLLLTLLCFCCAACVLHP